MSPDVLSDPIDASEDVDVYIRGRKTVKVSKDTTNMNILQSG